MFTGKLLVLFQTIGEAEAMNQAEDSGNHPTPAKLDTLNIFNRHVQIDAAISVSTNGGNHTPAGAKS